MPKTIKSFTNVKDAILEFIFLFLLNCLCDLSIILNADIRVRSGQRCHRGYLDFRVQWVDRWLT